MHEQITRLDTNTNDPGQPPNHGVGPGLRLLLQSFLTSVLDLPDLADNKAQPRHIALQLGQSIWRQRHAIVDLPESPIERVTPTGVKTKDREVELDILVLATGYDFLTGGLTSIDIRGTNGETLREKWSSGSPRAPGLAEAHV